MISVKQLICSTGSEYCEGPGMELGRVKANAAFLHPRALNELKMSHWALNASLKIIKDI